MPDIEKGLNRLPPVQSRYLSRLPAIMAFVGSTGSGKTYLALQLLSLLRREGVLDKVYLISPTASSNTLYKSVIREGYDQVYEHVNSPKVFDFLRDVERDVQGQANRWRQELELLTAYRKHQNSEPLTPHESHLLETYGHRRITPKRPRCALLIDDCQGSALFSQSPKNYLSQLTLRCRHVGEGVGLSIFLVAQTSRGIPRALRLQFTHLALYSTQNLKELEALYEESGAFVSRQEFERLFRLYTGASKHSIMFIDLIERVIKPAI